MNPNPKTVNDTLNEIARASESIHPTRQLARELVARYRRGTAIDPDYDFHAASEQSRQVIYNQILRFRCWRSWWMRLLRVRPHVRRAPQVLENEGSYAS